MGSRSLPTWEDEKERGDSRDAGKTEEIATAGNKLYDSVSGPLTVAVYECGAEGVSDEERASGRLGERASGEACRFEIRVNGEPVATVSSQMEAEQEIRRIAEQGVEPGQETGASATETIAMTPARAAEWRRLLCLLEQAQEVADRISDDDSARQARAIGDMAHRVRARLNEFTDG